MSTAASDMAKTWGSRGFLKKLIRRKVISEDMMNTKLERCLSPLAVILIGIGQMAAGGAFVVLGTAALYAGPGVVLSLAIGGLAAFVTGMCYAEFAATIPRAGSGYLFSYVTLGEFVAFIVGWQVILEELISISSMSSAISGAIDALSDNAISNYTMSNIGQFHHELLGKYPDFVALGVGLVTVIAMCFGVKNSILTSNIMNVIEVFVIIFCIIAGFIVADFSNWTYAGFLPYGFVGVMKGAAASFYAYIGFEGVACAGEETENPQKTIPMALFTSLGIMIVLYLLQSSALTLMVPFETIDPQSAFPEAFEAVGLPGVGKFVAIGIIIGLIGGLIGGIYTMTRITYAMADDGLIFKIFAMISHRTKTPLFSEIFLGCLAACLALIFNLEILVEFLSVGTLITYTIVAMSSIILHYQPRVTVYDGQQAKNLHPDDAESPGQVTAGSLKSRYQFLSFIEHFYPGFAVDVAVLMFAIFFGLLFTLLGSEKLLDGTWWAVLLLVLFIVAVLISYLIVIAHHKRRLKLPFENPSVPFIPALAIALNVLLLCNLSALTWIRFSVWFALGILIYFLYGIRHSRLNEMQLGEYCTPDQQSIDIDIIEDPFCGVTNIPAVDVDERTPLLKGTK